MAKGRKDAFELMATVREIDRPPLAYRIRPVFSMWRMIKYAEKASTVMAIETINWNSMSTSCNPAPYDIGGMDKSESTDHKHGRLEHGGKPAFRLRNSIERDPHQIVVRIECLAYSLKLLFDLVHALKGNRSKLRSQASPSPSAGSGSCFFGGRPIGACFMASRAAVSYNASLLMGLMPFWKRRCLTALGLISRIFAISETVMNSKPSTVMFFYRRKKSLKKVAFGY